MFGGEHVLDHRHTEVDQQPSQSQRESLVEVPPCSQTQPASGLSQMCLKTILYSLLLPHWPRSNSLHGFFLVFQWCWRSMTLSLVARENRQLRVLSSKHMTAGTRVNQFRKHRFPLNINTT